MSDPKRHHYVPELLSRRFTDSRGMVWYFDKRIPALGIRDTLPKNLMLQNYLYSETKQDGTKDHALEFQYSKIESDSSVVFDMIEQFALQAVMPALNRQERSILDEFVCAQWRRVPDFNGRVFESERFTRIVKESVEKLEQQRGKPLSEAELQHLESMKASKDFKHQARVRALKRPASQVLDALGKKALQVLVSDANSPYVLGSAPVLKSCPDEASSNLNHDLSEVRFAFHPRLALLFTNPQSPETLVSVPAGEVDFYNRNVARKSSIVAADSKETLATYRVTANADEPLAR